MTTKFEKYLYKAIKDDPLYELILRDHINQTFSFKNRLENKEQLIVFLKRMIPKMKKCLNKSDDIFNLLPDKIKSELYFMLDDNKYMRVLEYFNKLITPTMNERTIRGEVFTSLKLVDEMLDKLPKKVWLDPYRKWLDPANGIGNFPVRIFMRLMESLKNYKDEKLDLTDEEDRRKHILENMIYVIELDKKNCFLYKILLGHRGRYKLNILIGDSLSDNVNNHMEKVWKLNKFDIIVGNPPYQSFDEKTGKKKRGGKNNLYEQFILKYIKLIKKNGYFTFVTPSSWLSVSKKNQELRKDLLSYQLRHLNIHLVNKYFPKIGNNFCYFLIKINKKISENSINVECIYNKKEYKSVINQNSLPDEFIPLLLHKNSIDIINKILFNKRYEKKYDAKIRYEYEPRKKWVYVEKPNDNKQYWEVKTTKNRILYTDKHTELIGKEKIIIPTTKYYRLIEKTNLVTTQSYISILFDENDSLEYHLKFLKNKTYEFINNICRWGNWNYGEIVALFPKIEIKNLSNEKIYKHFKLTKDEIKLIEENVKDNN